MHIPVLKNEVLEILNPRSGKIYIDATCGEGGHLIAIIEKSKNNGVYLGIDLDKRNAEYLKNILEERFFGNKAIFVENASFGEIKQVAARHNIFKVDGILFDLGVSSWQIDESKRGFSFQRDELLDMRFNPSRQVETAADIVNKRSEEDIERILRDYGEEKYCRQIARGIVAAREIKKINTTGELVEIIKKSIPRHYSSRAIHPATRAFQGLRIAVNNELAVINESLVGAWELLGKGGVLIIISFHSLEDRLVKNFIKSVVINKEGKELTKKPILPSPEEINNNRRSRSAKLRAVIKE